jgi:hypothetical protein
VVSGSDIKPRPSPEVEFSLRENYGFRAGLGIEPRLDDISPAQKRSLSFKVTSTVVEPEQGLEGLY